MYKPTSVKIMSHKQTVMRKSAIALFVNFLSITKKSYNQNSIIEMFMKSQLQSKFAIISAIVFTNMIASLVMPVNADAQFNTLSDVLNSEACNYFVSPTEGSGTAQNGTIDNPFTTIGDGLEEITDDTLQSATLCLFADEYEDIGNGETLFAVPDSINLTLLLLPKREDAQDKAISLLNVENLVIDSGSKLYVQGVDGAFIRHRTFEFDVDVVGKEGLLDLQANTWRLANENISLNLQLIDGGSHTGSSFDRLNPNHKVSLSYLGSITEDYVAGSETAYGSDFGSGDVLFAVSGAELSFNGELNNFNMVKIDSSNVRVNGDLNSSEGKVVMEEKTNDLQVLGSVFVDSVMIVGNDNMINAQSMTTDHLTLDGGTLQVTNKLTLNESVEHLDGVLSAGGITTVNTNYFLSSGADKGGTLNIGSTPSTIDGELFINGSMVSVNFNGELTVTDEINISNTVKSIEFNNTTTEIARFNTSSQLKFESLTVDSLFYEDAILNITDLSVSSDVAVKKGSMNVGGKLSIQDDVAFYDLTAEEMATIDVKEIDAVNTVSIKSSGNKIETSTISENLVVDINGSLEVTVESSVSGEVVNNGLITLSNGSQLNVDADFNHFIGDMNGSGTLNIGTDGDIINSTITSDSLSTVNVDFGSIDGNLTFEFSTANNINVKGGDFTFRAGADGIMSANNFVIDNEDPENPTNVSFSEFTDSLSVKNFTINQGLVSVEMNSNMNVSEKFFMDDDEVGGTSYKFNGSLLSVQGDFLRVGGETARFNLGNSTLRLNGSTSQNIDGGNLFTVYDLEMINKEAIINVDRTIRVVRNGEIADSVTVNLSEFNIVMLGEVPDSRLKLDGTVIGGNDGGIYFGGLNTIFQGQASDNLSLEGRGTLTNIIVDVGNGNSLTFVNENPASANIFSFTNRLELRSGLFDVAFSGPDNEIRPSGNTENFPKVLYYVDNAQIDGKFNDARNTSTRSSVTNSENLNYYDVQYIASTNDDVTIRRDVITNAVRDISFTVDVSPGVAVDDKTYIWPENTLKYYDVIQDEDDPRATLLSIRNINVEESITVSLQFNSIDINGAEELFKIRGNVTIDGTLNNFDGPEGEDLNLVFDQNETSSSGTGIMMIPVITASATDLEFSVTSMDFDSLYVSIDASTLFNGDSLMTIGWTWNEGSMDVLGENREFNDVINAGMLAITGSDYTFGNVTNNGSLTVNESSSDMTFNDNFTNSETGTVVMSLEALSFNSKYENDGQSTLLGMNHTYMDSVINSGVFESSVELFNYEGEILNTSELTIDGVTGSINGSFNNQGSSSNAQFNASEVTFAGIVINEGTMVFNGSDATLASPFFNDGTVNVTSEASNFNLDDTLQNESTFDHNGAQSIISVIINNGTYTQTGSQFTAATNLVNDGVFTVTTQASDSQFSNIVNDSTFVVEANTNSFIDVINNGSFTKSGSNSEFQNNLENTGILDLSGNDLVIFSLVNDSTLNASGNNLEITNELRNESTGVSSFSGNGELTINRLLNIESSSMTVEEGYEMFMVETDIRNESTFSFRSPLTIDGTYVSTENSVNEIFADFTLTSQNPLTNEKGSVYNVENFQTLFDYQDGGINIVSNGATLSNVTTASSAFLTDTLTVVGNLVLQDNLNGVADTDATMVVSNNVSTLGDVEADMVMYGTLLDLNEDRRTFTGLLNISNINPAPESNTNLDVTNELYIKGEFLIDSTRIVDLNNYPIYLDGAINIEDKASIENAGELHVEGVANSIALLESNNSDDIYSASFGYLNLNGDLTVQGNSNEFAVRDSIRQNGPYQLNNQLANLVIQDGATIRRFSNTTFLPETPNYTGVVNLVYAGNSPIMSTGEIPKEEDVDVLDNMTILTDVTLVKNSSLNGLLFIDNHKLEIDSNVTLTMNDPETTSNDMLLLNPGARIEGNVDGEFYLIEYRDTGNYLMGDEVDRESNTAQIYFNSSGTYSFDRDYELAYISLEGEKNARLDLNMNTALFQEEVLDTGSRSLVNSINSGSGSFLINGSAPQTIIVPVDETFRMANSTTLNNPNGVSLSGGNMTLAPQDGSFITNGYVAFTFMDGIFTTEANNYLTLVQSSSTERTQQGFVRDLEEGVTSHVNGNVRKFITRTDNVAGAQARARVVFPVGTSQPNAYYRPLEFYLNEIEEGVDLTVRFNDESPGGFNGLGSLADPLVTKYPNFHWSVYSIPTLKEATEYEIHAFAEGFSIPDGSAIEDFSLIRRDVSSLDDSGSEIDPNTNPWEYTGSNYDNEESDEQITTTIVRSEGATGDIKENPVKFTYGYAGVIQVEPIASKLMTTNGPAEIINLNDVFTSETDLEYSALSTDTEEEYLEFMFDGDNIEIKPRSSTKDTTVTIIYSATDNFGENLALSFNVRVVDAPLVVNPLEDVELTVGGDSVSFDFTNTFSSDISDLGLRYTLTNMDETIAEIEDFNENQFSFSIDDIAAGVTDVYLTVTDSLNATATDTINVTVNSAPEINDLQNQTFTLGQTSGLPVELNMSTTNGTGPFIYSASSDEPSIAVVTVENNVLTLVPGSESGMATISYSTLDARNVSSTKTIEVIVNESVSITDMMGTILLDISPMDNPNRVAPSDTTLVLDLQNMFAGGTGTLQYSVVASGDYFTFDYEENTSTVSMTGSQAGSDGYFTITAIDSFSVSATDTVIVNVVNTEYPDAKPYWDTISLSNDSENEFWNQPVLTQDILENFTSQGIEDFETRMGFFSNIQNVNISAAAGDTLSFLYRAIETGSNLTDDVMYELGTNPPAGAEINKVQVNGNSYGKFEWLVPEGFDTGELNIRVIAYNENDESLFIEDFSTIFISSSTSITDEVPVEFSLGQNYPNPFNPSTTINYSLKEAVSVNIDVYNTLGQKVAVLVDNKMQNTGLYSVNFDATDLSSGIYIYRLQAGSYVETRKMLLLK